ncbi:hypothetical protein MuYL_3087 [Mucilaginibacter xinganensis]|uniref:Uncharacterized protein n=1 Tax=Mucilaginibacter xinganensis TaxID=1234841 RepID=A0A223NYN7_9SPHI|nr:hypothetical protein MuYL_3087 [Mucilaginibacter xinganensis]
MKPSAACFLGLCIACKIKIIMQLLQIINPVRKKCILAHYKPFSFIPV